MKQSLDARNIFFSLNENPLGGGNNCIVTYIVQGEPSQMGFYEKVHSTCVPFGNQFKNDLMRFLMKGKFNDCEIQTL